MMVWGHGFFAKTMIPDHHAIQISFIKRQQPLINKRLLLFTLYHPYAKTSILLTVCINSINN
ncbi:hypothetical protein XNC1_1813 [Xenorhabdus nematophila ATCC 19061]|uniref:Uncharacterized protein n=2 Tax=Xenorhabdus nematophila TaxID=628 RepID=D3VD07_XENNA|nr:hypothetical protein XNC1_1813 [Xenorhabdus nematophila ATCC 19061]CEK22753.1 hypothetical protein XNC2_1759 [Xenorhabdus nematophila AN6/1]